MILDWRHGHILGQSPHLHLAFVSKLRAVWFLHLENFAFHSKPSNIAIVEFDLMPLLFVVVLRHLARIFAAYFTIPDDSYSSVNETLLITDPPRFLVFSL
mmetsp:Transcript_51584/g.117415  ORF Transcript_51584/g.117415 Transcript_51584/m.117415 type:complete len:100 (+) Transcript_51584:1208-1507(+)